MPKCANPKCPIQVGPLRPACYVHWFDVDRGTRRRVDAAVVRGDRAAHAEACQEAIAQINAAAEVLDA